MWKSRAGLLAWLGFAFLQSLSALQTKEPQFVHLGEGYTAARAGEEMRVEGRMFSAPDPICDNLPEAKRFEAPSGALEFSVGGSIGLGELGVTAVDSQDNPVRPIPVSIEIEEGSLERLNTEEYRSGGRAIIPMERGELLFQIRSICTMPIEGIVVRAIVR